MEPCLEPLREEQQVRFTSRCLAFLAIMTVIETELIDLIENAFMGVTLDHGISLTMTDYLEFGGVTPAELVELAAKDERKDWRIIADATLEEFAETFCFTDLLGYRFYAAPYMIWTIRNHKTSDSFISDATIYAMDPNRHQFKRIEFTEWFTRTQIEAILAFLDYCAANDDTLDGDVAAKNAAAIRELSEKNRNE